MVSNSVLAAGFSQGSRFSATTMYGQVYVQCVDLQGQSTQNSFTCASSVLSPTEYDYFLGPVIPADNVLLVATHANGTTRNKSVKYNSNTGVSADRVNLWNSTLTQRPLLEEGKNLVRWQLVKSNNVVAQGQFDVFVDSSRTLSCENRSYFSSDPNDCQNQYTMCSRYFNEGPACRR